MILRNLPGSILTVPVVAELEFNSVKLPPDTNEEYRREPKSSSPGIQAKINSKPEITNELRVSLLKGLANSVGHKTVSHNHNVDSEASRIK